MALNLFLCLKLRFNEFCNAKYILQFLAGNYNSNSISIPPIARRYISLNVPPVWDECLIIINGTKIKQSPNTSCTFYRSHCTDFIINIYNLARFRNKLCILIYLIDSFSFEEQYSLGEISFSESKIYKLIFNVDNS